MVRRTYASLMLRGVRGSLNRYLSILIITALGAGFLAGIISTTPDMKETLRGYYRDRNVFDIDIKGSAGLTDADVAAVAAVGGVKTAVPALTLDVPVTDREGRSYTARLYGADVASRTGSDGTALNAVTLTEGRLPENDGECLLANSNPFTAVHSIGETFTFAFRDGDSTADMLSVRELTVVGIMDDPLSLSIQGEPSNAGTGTVSIYLLADKTVFDVDFYTDIYVLADYDAGLDVFSDRYSDTVSEIKDALDSIGEARSELRLEELLAPAREELEQAKKDYNSEKEKAESELAEALSKLEDARAELDGAKQRLAEAKEEYFASEKKLASEREEYEKRAADARAQLAAAEGELAASESELAAAYAQLKASENDIANLRALIAAGLGGDEAVAAVAGYDAALAEYGRSAQALELGKAQLAQQRETAEAELAQAEALLAAAEAELAAARTEILSAESEIADGEAELARSEKEYASARAEADEKLADAHAQIEDAQKELDAQRTPTWYISDRFSGIGYSSFGRDAEKVEALSGVFPVFFYLVAALVSLTTIQRMIDEERGRMGVLRALGHSRGSVMSYYLGYAFSASLIGSVTGVLIGFKLFPAVIGNAYRLLYSIPPVGTPFRPGYAAAIVFVSVLIVTGTAFFSCRGAVSERPAYLLLPRAPKNGKRVLLERIPFVWKRLGFTAKISVRNLLRYKKRFFMTVAGVAGCCALLVTGFGIKDSISDIVDLQYGEIYKYDISVTLSDAPDEGLTELLRDRGAVEAWALFHSESGYISKDGKLTSVGFTVPETTDGFDTFITLRQRVSGEGIPFGEGSVVLTEKLCETLGVSPGDRVTFVSADGKEADLRVDAVAENYVSAFAYIAPDVYAEAFGAPEYRTVLLRSASAADGGDADRSDLAERILAQDCVSYLTDTSYVRGNFENSLGSINYIVVVLIIASGALAVIVLYNLINVNICERRKELATIKVLGFYEHEVASYIYREISVLCVIGTLVGLLLGIWLHSFVISTVEIDAVMFGRSIKPRSFLLAAILTLGFSALVDLLMLGKLRRVDMVESMKAND